MKESDWRREKLEELEDEREMILKDATTKDKPFKGYLDDWVRVPCSKELGLGYYYEAYFLSHERFAGRRGHTSYVVMQKGRYIETLNSRYFLTEGEA